MGVKLICGAAAVLLAVGQVTQIPQERRLALWRTAGHWLGLETVPAASVTTSSPGSPRPIVVDPVVARLETIGPDRSGQFGTDAESDGQRFSVLIDTGASSVVLTFEDADRLGFRPMPSDFKYWSNTANGRVANARVELRELRIGSVVVRDVTAFVAPSGALWRSLVGMNFLKRLSGFRVVDGRLVLQQ